jgi:oligopeptidase B
MDVREHPLHQLRSRLTRDLQNYHRENKMPSFPLAPKRPHVITQHGETRVDDYFWLRQRDDPEVLKYLTAQMDYLEEVMGHTKPLQERLFNEMKQRIQETDSTVPEKRGAYWYYSRTEAGKQYPIFCRRQESMNHPEEILLDQNHLAEGKTFCSVSGFAVSPDETKLAYAVDYDGDEVYTIHIKDLKTGSHYPETVSGTMGSVYAQTGLEWANDNQTIFYVKVDDTKRPHQLWRHVIGTDVAGDILAYEELDVHFFVFFYKSRDDKYIMLYLQSTLTTEMRFLPADQPDGELKILAPRTHGIEYHATHHDGTFFIATNEGAKNFKLMKASISNLEKSNWQEVVPHREDVLLDGLDSFANHIVVYERRGGLKQIRVSACDGVSDVHYVTFPEPAYNFELEDNSVYEATALRIKYSSLITPHIIADIHLDTGAWDVKKVESIKGFDKNDYATERVSVTAPDGVQVPMTLAYKKSLKTETGNPAVLFGYGAYGSTYDPEFYSHRLSLLDRGFVLAIGHIRGGAELGRAWYEDGKVLKKKNTFTDFIACAEHLIHKGYTTTDKLAIYGVSAGGLLVTSTMVMRPDLFKAVIAKVPFVDVVNSLSDPSIPLTTHEYDEWGNPVDNEEHYLYMKSYSPYDNLTNTAYPNLLLTGGLNDPRVAYWEPAKFAAKMNERKTDNNLLLLKTNFHAGHAGASGRYDFLKEVALEYAFLIERLIGI